MFSSCALPERGRASATNVNKLTDFQYASLFSDPSAAESVHVPETDSTAMCAADCRLRFALVTQVKIVLLSQAATTARACQLPAARQLLLHFKYAQTYLN